MSTIKTEYKGSLSTATIYPLSENPILTKAHPFGPTDLMTVSFGSCIVTYIDFVAKKNNFTIGKTVVEIKKTMNSDGTMITNFEIVINLNSSFTGEQKLIIETAAKSCPVGNSLHKDIERTYLFSYQVI
jgi:putative redox protein